MSAPGFVRYVARLCRFHVRQMRATSRVDGTVMSYVNIVVDDPAHLRIGAGSSVGSFTEINVTAQKDGSGRSGLYIGERVSIGMGCNLRGAGGVIEIGDAAMIGQQVSIIAANHSFDPGVLIRDQLWSTAPVDVHIESDAFIGCGATILPGVTVGRGAIVAAGSLVREDVAPWAIVAGLPARVIGTRKGASAIDEALDASARSGEG